MNKQSKPAHVLDDMIILVIDKKHPRYGTIAKQRYYDSREYGNIGVEFSDGHHEEIYDADHMSKFKVFYRHTDDRGKICDQNGWGPDSFGKTLDEIGANRQEIDRQYRLLFKK